MDRQGVKTVLKEIFDVFKNPSSSDMEETEACIGLIGAESLFKEEGEDINDFLEQELFESIYILEDLQNWFSNLPEKKIKSLFAEAVNNLKSETLLLRAKTESLNEEARISRRDSLQKMKDVMEISYPIKLPEIDDRDGVLIMAAVSVRLAKFQMEQPKLSLKDLHTDLLGFAASRAVLRDDYGLDDRSISKKLNVPQQEIQDFMQIYMCMGDEQKVDLMLDKISHYSKLSSTQSSQGVSGIDPVND